MLQSFNNKYIVIARQTLYFQNCTILNDSRKQLTIQSYICIFSFSLLDIQFKLLKVHSLDESFIASKGFRTLTYSSNKRDRFREYSLKQSDPKLVFVISNCILGNMKPKVVVT